MAAPLDSTGQLHVKTAWKWVRVERLTSALDWLCLFITPHAPPSTIPASTRSGCTPPIAEPLTVRSCVRQTATCVLESVVARHVYLSIKQALVLLRQASFSSSFSKRVNLKSWSLVFFILFLLFVNRSGLVPYYTSHLLIIAPTITTKIKHRKPIYIPNTAILRVAGRSHQHLITSLLLAQHDFRNFTILYERYHDFRHTKP